MNVYLFVAPSTMWVWYRLYRDAGIFFRGASVNFWVLLIQMEASWHGTRQQLSSSVVPRNK